MDSSLQNRPELGNNGLSSLLHHGQAEMLNIPHKALTAGRPTGAHSALQGSKGPPEASGTVTDAAHRLDTQVVRRRK